MDALTEWDIAWKATVTGASVLSKARLMRRKLRC